MEEPKETLDEYEYNANDDDDDDNDDDDDDDDDDDADQKCLKVSYILFLDFGGRVAFDNGGDGDN